MYSTEAILFRIDSSVTRGAVFVETTALACSSVRLGSIVYLQGTGCKSWSVPCDQDYPLQPERSESDRTSDAVGLETSTRLELSDSTFGARSEVTIVEQAQSSL